MGWLKKFKEDVKNEGGRAQENIGNASRAGMDAITGKKGNPTVASGVQESGMFPGAEPQWPQDGFAGPISRPPSDGMNPDQRAVSEHLGTVPIYGSGDFGYERDPYQVFNEGNDWYDPTRLGDEGYELTELEAMNFDPYRRNAMQDVSASSASGLASAEGGLARTGGVSAADRMALASQFNRDKISGRSGALGKYDEMESQNIFQVGSTNAQIANEAARVNAEQMTERDRSAAEQTIESRDKETAAGNLYEKEDSARRYKEKLDKYNADMEQWYLEGQFIAGGARKPKPNAPAPPDNAAGFGGGWGGDSRPDTENVGGFDRDRRMRPQGSIGR